MICNKCGKEIADGMDFCTECGANLKDADMFSGENKIILVLITLFAGSFGIHNFILGETKKGIVKIVAAVICGVVSMVLAYIDLIKIAKGTYIVDTEAFF